MKNEYLEPLWEAFSTYAEYPAVVDQGSVRSTTYRELGELVCRVAAWFASQDLKEHSFIPIILPSSVEYLAAEIGAWMSGHTAVPMGPAFPAERIAYIREHCEAPLAIDETTWNEIKKTEPMQFEGGVPDYPSEEVPALLIYTSGSTGNPKGILHTFGGLAVKHTSKVNLHYSPDEVWAMGAPMYFVASLTCFKVLKEGGQLHLINSETYRDIRRFEDYVVEHHVTFTFLSPSMLANFHNRSETLKVVFTGSERLTNQCSRDGYKLMNCYGMSETGGTVCAFQVKQPYDTTPVGRPEETWCLLDDDGNPVEEGEEGEFCLRGHYCEGYFKDPERTAELYRDGWLHTGDLLRQLPDGNLVYVNRKDWMAKINGQRVEPGEVENAIRKLDGVNQAVVKAFDNPTGGQFLCAFYTGDVEGEVLRDALAHTLPPYMVPSHFVAVREFALLPNGKVNRKVLAAPDASELRSDYVAPETETERILCEAYAKVFGLEQVGIDDDFFLLGGDSVRVMKLQQLCENLSFSTKVVARERTPRKIAAAIRNSVSEQPVGSKDIQPTPLTQTQLGIYAESMARKGEAVYQNPVLLKLDPSIDSEKLARAIEAAVQAHSFVKIHIMEDADGIPLMVPDDQPYRQTIEEVDEADFEAVKAQFITPFDLHKGPLFHIRIVRTPSSLYLFTDFHHIIFDGTSMRAFMTDVDSVYSGKEIKPEQYTGFDIALEETHARASSAYNEAKAYYEKTFGQLDLDCTPLPDTFENDVEYATLEVPLGIRLTALRRFCARIGITENIFAIAAFGKLLGTYANLNEALFATIYNGRSDLRCARTVSMMVKTLPVYCSWDAHMRVADYLQATKVQVIASMANDLFSFAEVATLVDVSSDVLFAYQGDYLALGTVCGNPFERIMLESNATGSALDFQVFAGSDGLFLRVEYQRNKYSDAYIADMATTYGCIAQGLLTCERLAEIVLINNEQTEVLDSFNKTEIPYDQSQTVVSLFCSAAAAYPQNVAAVYESAQLTYRELDGLTTALAAYLTKKGIGQGDVISVLVPRGLWMPVGSLGALKAGSAYQPLDPTYPSERLNFMIGDAQAKMLITTKELRQFITDYDGEVLIVDDVHNLLDLLADSCADSKSGEGDAIEIAPIKPIDTTLADVKPTDLFVLLYTSGTTGIPKGVRLTHRNLVCFINWYHRYYSLGPTHRVGAYASYGFDASMMDMYPALTCGAATVIVPEEMRLDLMAMANYLERNSVTHAFMTTQVGRQFAVDAECSSLEYLSMGGETLVPFKVPEQPLTYNAYGPSECTIFSTVYPLKGGEANFPIGKVLDNMKGYVVDSNGNRVPIGASGELWLAGPQIGDGYLNRPEKTAEAFGENPFDTNDYAPLYRTGDIVRYMRDGNIEFIGRRDGQVKIRGFRIELTEVEAVVRDFPGVRDATVAAFDHPSGGKFVAAYVVANEPIDVNEMGDFIRERKPPYMVPAAIMQIDCIPLNQNGKVNRRMLPEPEIVSTDDVFEDEASRTLNALEQELLDIAEEVIGTSGFGITVPLVRCGLTSIQSIRLLALVFKRFGVSIHAKDLSDDVSVVSLENMILGEWMSGNVGGNVGGRAGGNVGGRLEEAHAQPNEFRAPLTFAQTGIYYECLKNPNSLAYNIPAMFSFSTSVGAAAIVKALGQVIAAHPTLTAHFKQEGESVALVPCDEPISIERFECSEDEVLAYRDTFVRPFDLSVDPLARFAVASTPERICLFTDFHHLAFDGASMAIFLNELAAALGGADIEEEIYTFADHARDEQVYAESVEFSETRNHLAALFKDYENATELPANKSGREERGHRKTASSPFDFSAVDDACRNMGVTPAGFMLAATTYVLSRYANERRVFLSTISNGRSDVRAAETVGMFVNTLPLMVEVADETCADFVKRAATVLANAIANERYPFAHVAADYGFAPQVMYEYQLGVVEDIGLDSLIKVESLEADMVKFKCTIRIENVDAVPQVVLNYNDALYTDEFASEVARSIVIAAEKFALSSNESVRSIDLIDDARRIVLDRFHESATGSIDFTTYHEGLEIQAQRNPHATALFATDGTFTFEALNAEANRIAHALIARGVLPRNRVALLLPRTSRVIMAIFGVMKAGCAYIPCDPNYPEERVNHILKDSGAPLVITTSKFVSLYEGAVDVEELLTCDKVDNPNLDVSPDDLAYLIYTSGSTGKPKGVMLSHRGVCNFHTNHPSNILVDALCKEAHAFLSVTTLSFDMSVKEVGTPLVNGLAVVLANESQVNDPAALAKLMYETGADAFNATHSRLNQYLSSPTFAAAIARCKVVLSGGEKYTEGLLPLLQSTTHARIINTYGPTETTVSSNMADLTQANSITVGRPLYNVWECIVDCDGNELPVGIVGELLIGGAGVGVGYHGLPDKTAEAFIERDGKRMYRSGDYARWTPDGNVEILGRTDNQIKLRGLRIEIGEVESALAAVEGVKHAVVKIDELGGAEHLCAYFTADRLLEVAKVREEMSTTLAQYMLPTAFLQLDEFPLTPNGKVDYRGLPSAVLYRTGETVAAENDIEQLFCDIFSGILCLDNVGATDNFFEIGGTSLMAIRITVEAEKAGYQITYSDVFANPTPRLLASLCGVDANTDGADAEAAPDDAIESFDYTAINALLAENNLHNFVEGSKRPLGDILLTGAAGYLGIHILHEYLEKYSGKVHCLLRGHGDISATQRLKSQLFYYFERDYAELFGTRIMVVEGDVTGDLSVADNVRIDTVVNCAAVVKHFSSGTEIEDVNIGGVENLVNFCLVRDATLIQVSTGSTVKAALKPDAELMGKTSERNLYVGQVLDNRYVRSKFLAERLVLDAIVNQGLKAKIMRVGNLAPRTSDGEFQINFDTNAAMGRLKSFALLGCAAYDQLDATMEFSPIDETARAIMLLAQTPSACVLFHPFNHHAVLYGDVFTAMEKCGLPVRAVERDEFGGVLREAESDPEKARILTSMLAYTRKATGQPVVVPKAGNAYTMQVLYRLGFRWNPTPAAYVEQFLDVLEGIGFFDWEA